LTEELDEAVEERIKIHRGRRRVYEAPPQPAAQPPENTLRNDLSAGSRTAGARKIIKDYSMWSAGAGLVPLPVLDMAALAALELKMLKSLSAYYGMEFSGQKARAIVSALIGGFHGGLITGSILKLVPFVGASLMALTPVASGAITYAIGMVFMQHFESGGTLLDFDIVRGKERIRKELRDRKGSAAAQQ
jgi:uncharacterized protein (DUF697 family)